MGDGEAVVDIEPKREVKDDLVLGPVISFPMALLMLLLSQLPLLLLASWWQTQVKENHARCCRKHTS
jgi:hypothetical protein